MAAYSDPTSKFTSLDNVDGGQIVGLQTGGFFTAALIGDPGLLPALRCRHR